MPNHILVPLDGSSSAEYAIPHTAAIAKAFAAEITLLNVLEQPSASLRMPKADPLDWYLKKSEAETYLNAMKARLEKSHLSVKTVLLEGRATEQIVELAHTGNVDLVILSSHGGYDANGWAMSSILQQILQQIGTSALIIRANDSAAIPTTDLHYQRLLVPLDGSRRAGSALPMATALAQAHQAELMVVHIVSKPEMARHMPLTQEDEDLMNRIVERNQDEGNKYLEQLKDQLPTNVQTRLLVSDNVAATLQNLSEQEQIDLLIMSAHGYSGEAKWPYGGVANRFITDGTVPLLIVQDLPHKSSEALQGYVTFGQSVR